MRPITCTLILIACLLAPTAAEAATPADGQLWTETEIAREWWAVRGFDSCATIVPSFAPWPGDDITAAFVEGWARVGSCAFSLTPSFAHETRRWMTRFNLRYECAVVVHEAGHALGLEHEDQAAFPIMAESVSTIPGRCRRWAKGIVRPPPSEGLRPDPAPARASRAPTRSPSSRPIACAPSP